jgi:hypothetical protein
VIDYQAEEAKLKLVEVSGERVDNKAKLERIKQEEEAILAEKAEDKEAEQKAKVVKKAEPEAVPTAAAEKEQPVPQVFCFTQRHDVNYMCFNYFAYRSIHCLCRCWKTIACIME